MKTIIATITILLTACGASENSAPSSEVSEVSKPSVPYYRFWQGWKRDDLTETEFLKQLETFMPETPKTHAKNGLVAYAVGIPPVYHPSFIADEFALVAYESEAVYLKAKQTQEGKKYAAMHWDVFKQGPSKSSVPIIWQAGKQKIAVGQAYDVLNQPVNWQTGVNTFYIGLRNQKTSKTEFLDKMRTHVDLVASKLKPLGLRAYLILATEDFEVAYMNWPSQEALEKAFQSPAGKEVAADGNMIMDTLMWQPAKIFSGTAKPDQFIDFRFPTRK